MLNRFKKLNLPSLQIESSYEEALQLFYKELNNICHYYFENKKSPEVPRNFPPVTGAIVWLRMLNKRIEEIMVEFEVSSEFLYLLRNINKKRNMICLKINVPVILMLLKF